MTDILGGNAPQLAREDLSSVAPVNHNSKEIPVDPSRVAWRVDILLLTALFEERKVLKLQLKTLLDEALERLNALGPSSISYKIEELPHNTVDAAHKLDRYLLIRQENGVVIGTPLTLGVATLPQMGNVYASLYTLHYLQHHRPRLIFLLGICGSGDPAVAKLGDVVISTEVHWTNVHKLKPPADPALAKSQPDLAVYQVWNRAQFAPESGWLGVMEHYFEHHEEDLPSNWSHPPIAKPAQDSKAPREYWPDATQKVAFGPLLATNHVVDHAGLRDKHKGEAKAIGIEMESAGVFAAIALHNNVSVRPKPPRAAGFVFKGVSDHCSQKGDNAWRQIAGSNAAYAALTFIFCNLAFIDHQIPAADRAVKQKRRTSSAYQQRMRNRRTK